MVVVKIEQIFILQVKYAIAMRKELTVSERPRIETIVLGVGNRDETRVDVLAEHIKEVAIPSDATVVVAHVFDSDSYREAVEEMLDASTDDIESDQLAARMTITAEIADRLDADGIEYETRATTDTSGEGVVEIANKVDADRVIIGGRRRSPTRKAIFGSTAQEVMLNAPCPVTFVRS
jgi:nucleotide-binding universal stress UspA family protein